MLQIGLGSSEFGLQVLQVTFTDQETIELDLADFYKDQSFLGSLYTQINEYIATLPLATQREIYDVYHKVYAEEYRQNYSDPAIVVRLERNIAKVCDLLNYDNFKIWIARKENEMSFPDTVKDVYIYDPDMNTTEEKTYVRHEYRDLIGLIIFIRALSPLYLNFYNHIKQITTHFYYKIFMLFVQSSIYTCPEIEKLKRYIEVNQQTMTANSKHEQLIIAAGLSDDDVLDSLVSEIIFNKLLTIDFFNKKCNIISFIFQTIKYKGNFITSDSVAIRGKSPTNDQGKDDMSYFEDYRKTSDVTIGIIVEVQDALCDPKMLATQLGYHDFDHKAYTNELQNVAFLSNQRIDKIQLYLLGWFLDRVVNPRSLHYIETSRVVSLMLFAKTVLLQRGHKFLGVLMGSYRTEGNFINNSIKNSLSKALIKRLNDRYSFVMEDDRQSVIEKTITEIGREIFNCLWVPVGTSSQLSGVMNNEGYLEIPSNINDLICSYVEFVNTPS